MIGAHPSEESWHVPCLTSAAPSATNNESFNSDAYADSVQAFLSLERSVEASTL
jgi:hypothetical protein